MKIVRDDLTGSEITKFLDEHIQDMRSVSPPESKHALDLDALKQPEITFWTMFDDKQIVGCVALKDLGNGHGEIKSMRTSREHRRRGIGMRLMEHILTESKSRKYNRLSLETGSMDFFEHARSLYRRFGFQMCGPFSTYIEDPNSVFMTIDLSLAQPVAGGDATR